MFTKPIYFIVGVKEIGALTLYTKEPYTLSEIIVVYSSERPFHWNLLQYIAGFTS